MAWQQTPYLVPLFAAATVSTGWALYGVVSLVRSRWRLHVAALVVLNLAVAVWAAVYAIQVASVGLATKLLAYKVLHVGGVVVPPAWLVFALAYTDRDEWITPATVSGLAIVPLALLLTLPTNPASLALTAVTIETAGSLRTLETGNGPVYLLYLGYAYVLLLVGGYFLVRTAIRHDRTYSGGSVLLLVGVTVPLLANVLDVFGLFPPDGVGINFTPISLSLSAFLFSVAVFRYRLFDLSPVARDTVFENMREGVVVLNEDGVVVDVNPAARGILDIDASAVGRSAAEVIPSYDRLVRTHDGPVDIERERVGPGRFVDMSRSRLARNGELRGWVVLFHDVTAREERAREVGRQNERLDKFASAVAHDLRNPLNVLVGYADLARETGAEHHFEEIEKAAERMDLLLENVLNLSRMGRTIDELAPVDVDATAREAWSLVATREATLAVSTGGTVDADANGLRRVFENLFRNAVEHGGPDVAVRVGRIEGGDGFYVEDDGPGVREEARGRVFDPGYSTGDGGTGLGLNIVSEIVEAHGWRILVTEGVDGGCRFEITGTGIVEATSQ